MGWGFRSLKTRNVSSKILPIRIAHPVMFAMIYAFYAFLPMRLKRTLSSFGILFFLTPLYFLGSPSEASANLYRIININVDVTAQTAVEAHNLALVEAEREAFNTLMQKLVLREDLGIIPPLPSKEISNFVQDIAISEEKSSGVRYIATINVSFREENVRLFLTGLGARFAETEHRPVLLLPLYQEKDFFSLWDEFNLWRVAFEDLNNTLIPLVLPKGDLADLATLSTEAAVDKEARAIKEMADRYGVSEVFLMEAHFRQLKNEMILSVDLIPFGVTSARNIPTRYFRLRTKTETEHEKNLHDIKQKFLNDAASQMIMVFQEEWKKTNLINFSTESSLMVNIPIIKLEDWVGINRNLKNISLIKEIKLTALSHHLAKVSLTHYGTHEQLTISLAQIDFVLGKKDTDLELEWTLTSAKTTP